MKYVVLEAPLTSASTTKDEVARSKIVSSSIASGIFHKLAPDNSLKSDIIESNDKMLSVSKLPKKYNSLSEFTGSNEATLVNRESKSLDKIQGLEDIIVASALTGDPDILADKLIVDTTKKGTQRDQKTATLLKTSYSKSDTETFISPDQYLTHLEAKLDVIGFKDKNLKFDNFYRAIKKAASITDEEITGIVSEKIDAMVALGFDFSDLSPANSGKTFKEISKVFGIKKSIDNDHNDLDPKEGAIAAAKLYYSHSFIQRREVLKEIENILTKANQKDLGLQTDWLRQINNESKRVNNGKVSDRMRSTLVNTLKSTLREAPSTPKSKNKNVGVRSL